MSHPCHQKRITKLLAKAMSLDSTPLQAQDAIRDAMMIAERQGLAVCAAGELESLRARNRELTQRVAELGPRWVKVEAKYLSNCKACGTGLRPEHGKTWQSDYRRADPVWVASGHGTYCSRPECDPTAEEP